MDSAAGRQRNSGRYKKDGETLKKCEREGGEDGMR